jgi:hypothetical protein
MDLRSRQAGNAMLGDGMVMNISNGKEVVYNQALKRHSELLQTNLRLVCYATVRDLTGHWVKYAKSRKVDVKLLHHQMDHQHEMVKM